MTSRLDDLIREHAERLEQLAGPIALTEITSRVRGATTTVTLVESEPTGTRPESRHRWPIIAVAAAAVGAILIGGLVFAPRDDSSDEVPAGPPTTVAPASGNDAATLVATWSERYRGWVLVYGDGRVLMMSEQRSLVPDEPSLYATVERYLTPEGLNRVQSGTLTPSELFELDPVPAAWWADVGFAFYAPAHYAACAHVPDGVSLQPTYALERLPAPVQDLLRDVPRRTYTPTNIPYPNIPDPNEPVHRPQECFTVLPELARTLVQTADNYHVSRADALHELATGRGPDVLFITADGSGIALHIAPIMPHGQPVGGGG